MERKAPFDIVNEVLEQCLLAYHHSSFLMSLYQQYQQRGSLSKKQLQGLYGKASVLKNLPPGKLATLEALINKMATRFPSPKPDLPSPPQPPDEHRRLMQTILERYPGHKRVLFLQSKLDNRQELTKEEAADLRRMVQSIVGTAR